MSRICAITGKRPKTGGRIIHKGVSKKAGGIGLQLVKVNSVNLSGSASSIVQCLRGKLGLFGYQPKLKAGKVQTLVILIRTLNFIKPNKDALPIS